MMASDGSTTESTAQISVDITSPEKITEAAIGHPKPVSFSEAANQTTEQAHSARAPESGNGTGDHDASTKTNGFSTDAAHTQEDSEEPTAKRLRISEEKPEENDITEKADGHMSVDDNFDVNADVNNDGQKPVREIPEASTDKATATDLTTVSATATHEAIAKPDSTSLGAAKPEDRTNDSASEPHITEAVTPAK
ncbi:hypothetical protein FB639_003495, partial [Coemansia asiatica]